MKWSAFTKSHNGAIVENKLQRTINLLLAVSVVLLAVVVLNQNKIVVIQPEPLGQEAWVTKESASQSYHEAWGLHLAQLTGNITATNVDFLIERLKPMLAPNIYNEVSDILAIQRQAIIEDRITYRFEPKEISFEESTGKVFVFGTSFVKGAENTESSVNRTYEYRLKIEQYAPLIVDLNSYEGRPRTQTELARMAANNVRG